MQKAFLNVKNVCKNWTLALNRGELTILASALCFALFTCTKGFSQHLSGELILEQTDNSPLVPMNNQSKSCQIIQEQLEEFCRKDSRHHEQISFLSALKQSSEFRSCDLSKEKTYILKSFDKLLEQDRSQSPPPSTDFFDLAEILFRSLNSDSKPSFPELNPSDPYSEIFNFLENYFKSIRSSDRLTPIALEELIDSLPYPLRVTPMSEVCANSTDPKKYLGYDPSYRSEIYSLVVALYFHKKLKSVTEYSDWERLDPLDPEKADELFRESFGKLSVIDHHKSQRRRLEADFLSSLPIQIDSPQLIDADDFGYDFVSINPSLILNRFAHDLDLASYDHPEDFAKSNTMITRFFNSNGALTLDVPAICYSGEIDSERAPKFGRLNPNGEIIPLKEEGFDYTVTNSQEIVINLENGLYDRKSFRRSPVSGGTQIVLQIPSSYRSEVLHLRLHCRGATLLFKIEPPKKNESPLIKFSRQEKPDFKNWDKDGLRHILMLHGYDTKDPAHTVEWLEYHQGFLFCDKTESANLKKDFLQILGNNETDPVDVFIKNAHACGDRASDFALEIPKNGQIYQCIREADNGRTDMVTVIGTKQGKDAPIDIVDYADYIDALDPSELDFRRLYGNFSCRSSSKAAYEVQQIGSTEKLDIMSTHLNSRYYKNAADAKEEVPTATLEMALADQPSYLDLSQNKQVQNEAINIPSDPDFESRMEEVMLYLHEGNPVYSAKLDLVNHQEDLNFLFSLSKKSNFIGTFQAKKLAVSKHRKKFIEQMPRLSSRMNSLLYDLPYDKKPEKFTDRLNNLPWENTQRYFHYRMTGDFGKLHPHRDMWFRLGTGSFRVPETESLVHAKFIREVPQTLEIEAAQRKIVETLRRNWSPSPEARTLVATLLKTDHFIIPSLKRQIERIILLLLENGGKVEPDISHDLLHAYISNAEINPALLSFLASLKANAPLNTVDFIDRYYRSKIKDSPFMKQLGSLDEESQLTVRLSHFLLEEKNQAPEDLINKAITKFGQNKDESKQRLLADFLARQNSQDTKQKQKLLSIFSTTSLSPYASRSILRTILTEANPSIIEQYLLALKTSKSTNSRALLKAIAHIEITSANRQQIVKSILDYFVDREEHRDFVIFAEDVLPTFKPETQLDLLVKVMKTHEQGFHGTYSWLFPVAIRSLVKSFPSAKEKLRKALNQYLESSPEEASFFHLQYPNIYASESETSLNLERYTRFIEEFSNRPPSPRYRRYAIQAILTPGTTEFHGLIVSEAYRDFVNSYQGKSSPSSFMQARLLSALSHYRKTKGNIHFIEFVAFAEIDIKHPFSGEYARMMADEIEEALNKTQTRIRHRASAERAISALRSAEN